MLLTFPKEVLDVCGKGSFQDCMGAVCSNIYKDRNRRPAGQLQLPKQTSLEYAEIRAFSAFSAPMEAMSFMFATLPPSAQQTAGLLITDPAYFKAWKAVQLFLRNPEFCTPPPSPSGVFSTETSSEETPVTLNFTALPESEANVLRYLLIYYTGEITYPAVFTYDVTLPTSQQTLTYEFIPIRMFSLFKTFRLPALSLKPIPKMLPVH